MKRFVSAMILPALLLSTAAGAATVTLKVGETRQLGNATVTLLTLQDSRCPSDVTCIRAGELRVGLLVTEGRRSRFVKMDWPAARNVAQPGGLRILEVPRRKASDRSSALPVTLTDQPL